MAIADGGELIVMAPGVNKFGEDPGIDALIREVKRLGADHGGGRSLKRTPS